MKRPQTKPPTESVSPPISSEKISGREPLYASDRWKRGDIAWTLAHAAFEGVAISQGGVIMEANAAFARNFGYQSSDQMKGITAEALATPEYRAEVARRVATQSEQAYEALLLRRDGTTFYGEMRGRSIEIDGYPARITTVRDITERIAADQALLESQSRLAEAQRLGRVGSWNLDVETGQMSWSVELFRLFGMDPAEVEPTLGDMLGHYHPDDRPVLSAAVNQCIQDGLPYEFDTRLLHSSGECRWVHAIGEGKRDPSGTVARLFGTLIDVNDRVTLQAEVRDRADRLDRSERGLRLLLEGAPLILFTADPSGAVTLSQGTGLAALGLKPGDAVGKSIFDFSAGNPEMDRYHHRALAGEAVTFDAQYGALTYHTELRPVHDDMGKQTGIIGVCFDITERQRAQSSLAESRQRLALATGSAKIGIWDWDVKENIMIWDDQMYALYGIHEEDFTGCYEAWRKALHPEDQAQAEADLGIALRGMEDFHTEFRVVWPTGEVRHIEAHSILQRDDSGSPLRMIGANWDVTGRRLAELERAQTEERFRVLFERSSDAHLIFDDSGIIDANPAAVRLLRGQSVEELVGLHPAVLSPEFQPDGRRSDEKCIEMDGIARQNGFHRFEWTHRRLDGEEVPVEVTLTHVTLSQQPALLVVWHDLTEIKHAEKQIVETAAKLKKANDDLLEQQSLLDERLIETAEMNILLEAQRYQLERVNERLNLLATTDGLTGVLNHRSFQEHLVIEIDRSWRSGEPLSIAFLDVDHFKAFNDKHGHQAGDNALRVVAATLVGACRTMDVVARYGGEEFAIIFPRTALSAAFETTERLRHAIERIQLETGPITASFGVATLGEVMSKEELINTADRAMYRSKTEGRNRTTMAA